MLIFQNINLNILNKAQNYFIMDKETNVRKEKKRVCGPHWKPREFASYKKAKVLNL